MFPFSSRGDGVAGKEEVRAAFFMPFLTPLTPGLGTHNSSKVQLLPWPVNFGQELWLRRGSGSAMHEVPPPKLMVQPDFPGDQNQFSGAALHLVVGLGLIPKLFSHSCVGKGAGKQGPLQQKSEPSGMSQGAGLQQLHNFPPNS